MEGGYRFKPRSEATLEDDREGGVPGAKGQGAGRPNGGALDKRLKLAADHTLGGRQPDEVRGAGLRASLDPVDKEKATRAGPSLGEGIRTLDKNLPTSGGQSDAGAVRGGLTRIQPSSSASGLEERIQGANDFQDPVPEGQHESDAGTVRRELR